MICVVRLKFENVSNKLEKEARTSLKTPPGIVERLSFEHEMKVNRQIKREPSFWSFDWFFQYSANACGILMDFGTGSFDVMLRF